IKGGIDMKNYQLENVNGKYNLYSSKINMYVMENVTLDDIKVAIATEMEYKTKLEIVKLLMTFPHGITTIDNQVIVDNAAVEAYEAWHHEIHQRIGFLDEYYSLIDQKIVEILT